MANALDQLLAMAVKPKSRQVKPPKTYREKFKEAMQRQHELLMKPDRPSSKTDWFQQVEDGYHVRLGRKKIGIVGADGKEQFKFVAANREQVNQIFLLAEQLLEENDDFRAKVLDQYGSEEEKAAAADTPPSKKRGGKAKAQ